MSRRMTSNQAFLFFTGSLTVKSTTSLFRQATSTDALTTIPSSFDLARFTAWRLASPKCWTRSKVVIWLIESTLFRVCSHSIPSDNRRQAIPVVRSLLKLLLNTGVPKSALNDE